jgi:superfamily II DNA or RNA helicase
VRLLFDQGTIVIRDPSPGSDPAGLPGVLWDGRVRAFRAPARRYGELKAALVRRGLSFADEVRGQALVPRRWQAPVLRPYQEAALCAWELAARRGVVVLPTGSGKTRLALAALAQSRLSALCLVPTRLLLAQWRREIAGGYDGPVGCCGDGAHEVHAVTVATFESAYRHMSRLGNRFDLLVVDEVHHFGCGLRDEALEMSLAAARIGLTATLPRDDAARERLRELVGPTVYELAVGDLAGTFLSSFDVVTLHVELTRGERAVYDRSMAIFRSVHDRFRRMAPGASWRDFTRSATRTPQGRRALEAFRCARRVLAFPQLKRLALAELLRRHRGARLLVFTADNATAYAVAREHLIMPFTCDIGRTEREEVMERFREGALHALVSARVLNEGVDVPDADVAIIVGGALGEREHVQRVGRLLRPREGKRALVYELVVRDTVEVRLARRRRAGLAARAAALRQHP